MACAALRPSNQATGGSTEAGPESETPRTTRARCGHGCWGRLRWPITASMETHPLRRVFWSRWVGRFTAVGWAQSEKFSVAIHLFPRRDATPRPGVSRNYFARGSFSALRKRPKQICDRVLWREVKRLD